MIKQGKAMQHSVFISGAAQGIGAEIARMFYRQGYKVGIYDINDEQARQLADELGENAKAGYLDVSNFRQWQIALQDFKIGQVNSIF
jgi:NAD(P)-dependent dehydrogenase (short-subunit alcohol dehydrogenase family)